MQIRIKDQPLWSQFNIKSHTVFYQERPPPLHQNADAGEGQFSLFLELQTLQVGIHRIRQIRMLNPQI
jgi:hypothetical protein